MNTSIPGDLGRATQNSMDNWLKNLGFSRGNPFASTEADQERAMLPEFFVNVDGYEQIKANKSVIIFAPLGGGKSALRVILASYAAPQQANSTTLAVEFTDFDSLITKYQSEQTITVDDFVTRLIRATTKTLWEFVCGGPTLNVAHKHHTHIKQVPSISMPVRTHLANMVRTYYPTLLAPREIYRYFQAFDPKCTLDWHAFSKAATNRCLGTAILPQLSDIDPVVYLIADLNDSEDFGLDPLMTPTEKILELVHLCQDLGLQVIQFLIDRLDESVQMADDPDAQVAMLEPLLAHLPIIEMPNVAFKFFLTRKTRDLLLNRPTIRRDRLTDQAVTIKWEKRHLKTLLDERLEAYSEGSVHDLPSLFIKTSSDTETLHVSKRSDFEIGKQVETEMLQLAQGSPRRLLLACHLLFQAHVKRIGPTGLLEREDWEKARMDLMHKMPPLLHLQRNASIAWLGDQKIKLTPRECAILQALVEYGGKCSRDQLNNAAWKTDDGVSEQAVDQAISRLREKLGDSSDNSIYLITERGKGFILRNYESE